MIKNIVLDMGNVLMNYDPNLPLKQFCINEEDRALIHEYLFKGPEWIAGDLGIMGNEQRYETVSKKLPERLHKALKDCVYRWQESMMPIEEAEAFVQFVKDKGYKLYILSNASDAFYEYFPRFAPLDFFDGIVVSSDIHMIKPDEKIYRYLLEKYELQPKECLFIDDRLENVWAAQKVGMEAVCYHDNFDEIKSVYSL